MNNDTTSRDSVPPGPPAQNSTPPSPGVTSKAKLDDMDDQHDLALFAEAPQLQKALVILNDTVRPAYILADQDAMSHQKHHRWLVITSATCGTLAVVFAVAQLAIVQLSASAAQYFRWMKPVELASVALGFLCVLLGLWAAKQTSWLRERHKAERCRLLKFRFLAHRHLWCAGTSGMDAWQKELDGEMARIRSIAPKSLKAWAEDDKPTEAPPPLVTCALPVEAVRAIIAYYTKKRVTFQSDYFHDRSTRYSGRDRRLRLLPAACFFVSVLCAVGHSLIDVLSHDGGTAHHWSLWLFLCAACLPVVGAGVRTYRSAHEFARSASLFHAKHHCLEDLKKELQQADPNNPGTVMHLIWKCEDYLEREHREWLWLMLEAEWFG